MTEEKKKKKKKKKKEKDSDSSSMRLGLGKHQGWQHYPLCKQLDKNILIRRVMNQVYVYIV